MSDDLTLPAGYRLHSFESLDSTNEEALRRIADGAGEGDVIWAARQTGGRGRPGRMWYSPPGNLYVTFVVAVPPDRAVGQLAFVTAVAAGEAVGPLLASPALLRYKWPNDLMLDGRKLGGILIEASPRGRTDLVAVGLGLNVDSGPPGLPAACLEAAGVSAGVPDILSAVCRTFDVWCGVWRHDGFAPVRERWLAAAYGVGYRLEVRFPDGATVDGTFRGIDPGGALVLQRPDGKTEPIPTGEVFFAPA